MWHDNAWLRLFGKNALDAPGYEEEGTEQLCKRIKCEGIRL